MVIKKPPVTEAFHISMNAIESIIFSVLSHIDPPSLQPNDRA